ncbi:MAG: HD domain-containing protein [Erysipelotrichaceae bacterium]|nr:HD domain-containing protein [Erysipelotrichaceae bacterium]
MDKKQLAENIARSVYETGGRVFYVGGCVRDKLLNIENKDIDIEVHGISPSTLKEILEQYGTVKAFGKSFGVYQIAGYDIDIAMPRRERAIGKGHRDFEIDVDPFIGYEEAARRRDFTINALMEDVLTGQIIDSFGGLEDLKNKVIRCVDPVTFIEDPLRVLRAAQFASRFEFEIDKDTIELCKSIDLSTLSEERIEEELKKALLKAERPSIFFESLRKMEQLDTWFPMLKDLIGLKQDPIYHPEGDVWNHTMDVLDRCTKYLDRVSNPYAFMLLGLCHDLGKIITTEEINGRIHSYSHEIKGLPLIKTFIRRFSNEKDIIKYVLNLTSLHMRPFSLAKDHSGIKSTNKVFDKCIAPYDLILFSIADKGDKAKKEDIDFLLERYAVFEEYMSRPYVSGDDLIAAGLKPDTSFSQILEYAHKLRLAGVNKDHALKQSLAYADKLKK